VPHVPIKKYAIKMKIKEKGKKNRPTLLALLYALYHHREEVAGVDRHSLQPHHPLLQGLVFKYSFYFGA
jgi:hypothetical protein